MFPMTQRAQVSAAVLLASLIGLTGCGADGNKPGLRLFPDMADSAPYDYYDSHPTLPRQQAAQLPPVGTVPVSGGRFLYGPENDDEAYLYRFAGLATAALGSFAASAYFLSRTFIFPLFFLIAVLNAIPFVAQREVWPEDEPPPIVPKRDVLTIGTIGVLLSIIYIYFSILVLNRVAHG